MQWYCWMWMLRFVAAGVAFAGVESVYLLICVS